MTKMAVYQPRRAAIATILVAVMQDVMQDAATNEEGRKSGYGGEKRKGCID